MNEPAPTTTTDGIAARELLEHAGRVERRVTAQTQAAWFPLGLFGALSLVAAAVAALAGGAGVGVFWSVAGPVGGVAIAAFYVRRETSLGFESRHAAALIAVAVLVEVGCLVTGWIGGARDQPDLAAFGPAGCVLAGYAAFAIVLRSRVVAAAAVAIATGLLAIAALDLTATGALVSTNAVTGFVLLTSAAICAPRS